MSASSTLKRAQRGREGAARGKGGLFEQEACVEGGGQRGRVVTVVSVVALAMMLPGKAVWRALGPHTSCHVL